MFISHAWEYNFLEVIDALVYHFRNEPDVIVWLDIFSCNQHRTMNLDFNFWSGTFKSAIQSMGRTVMVLSPWNNPIPLTRAWCLWELYCTAHMTCKFEVAMTENTTEQFLDDMKDPIEEIDKMLATIDVANSKCFNPTETVLIHECVRREVGYTKLNSMVFDLLRNWIISKMEETCREILTQTSKSHPDALIAMNNMAVVYESLGRQELVEPLLVSCLEMSLKVLGKNHRGTLCCMNNLAGLYLQHGRYEVAETLYVACLETRKVALGDAYPDTLSSTNDLAMLYERQGRFHEAELLLKLCLEKRRQVLGDKNPDTLISLNNLASLYESQGKYDEAVCIVFGETDGCTWRQASRYIVIHEQSCRVV